MPYIILTILVIAIVIAALRRQKFNNEQAQRKAEEEKIQQEINERNREKANSIEVDDYVEIKSSSSKGDSSDRV